MEWLQTAFGRIVGFLPDLIAGIVVLAVGVLIAWLLARIVSPLLHRIGFDRLLARHHLIGDEERRGGSRAGGQAVFWIVFLAAAVQAARAFRLDFVAVGLARVLAYVPHLVAAAVIFGAALLFGDWVRGRMREGERTPSVAPGAVRAGILALGAFMALRELLIAPQIVTIAFTLALGTIAVATALSFGLGTRSTAERMARDWYDDTERRVGPRPHGREPHEEPPVQH